MANANDPLGRAAERIADNARLTALNASIAAWTGDSNGLKDLQLKACELFFRLNASSTGGNAMGTAFSMSGFGLEQVAT